MKVILKQDVDSLGGTGDIVEVADGYGVNYLMPRGLAMRATKGALRDAEIMRRSRAKRDAKTLGDARELQSALERAPVRVPAKAGEDGTLYGSVGNTAIADAVRSQLGVALDRRRIPMERPLKSLGRHEVAVRIHPEVSATLVVEVVRAG